MPQILYISNLIFHSVVLPRPANFGYTSILFKRSNEESFLPICMLISCASFALLLCLSAALSANESKSNFLWTMCELPFHPFTNLTYVAGLALLTEPFFNFRQYYWTLAGKMRGSVYLHFPLFLGVSTYHLLLALLFNFSGMYVLNMPKLALSPESCLYILFFVSIFTVPTIVPLNMFCEKLNTGEPFLILVLSI